MSPSEVLALGDRAPRLLSFCSLVGTWIRLGESRRAWRAVRDLFAEHWHQPGHAPDCTPDSFAWAVTTAFPVMRAHEAESGWAPEAWLMRMIQVCVPDWQSRDWTALIRRWCGENLPAVVAQRTSS